MENEITNKEKSKIKIDWWIYSIPIIFILAWRFHFIIYSRSSHIKTVALFYGGPYIITFLCIVFLMFGIIRSFRKRPFFNYWRIVGFLALSCLCFSGQLYHEFPSFYDDKPSKIAFRLPLDTAVTVFWGGSSEQNNYHAVATDQRWAYDLAVLKNDNSFSGDSTKLENYYCYGLPVLSPADGKIIKVVDTEPDVAIGKIGGYINEVGGNHLIIQVAPKEFLFICHLKPKSIKVKQGDNVKQGQELALVGNSGNTSEPHIHIHLQDSKEEFIAQGIPLYFHHYTVNGKFVARGIPTGGFDDNDNFIGQTVKNVTE